MTLEVELKNPDDDTLKKFKEELIKNYQNEKLLQELKEKIEAEQEQEDFQSKLANEMHESEQFSIRHFFEQVLEGELCVTEIYDEAAKEDS